MTTVTTDIRPLTPDNYQHLTLPNGLRIVHRYTDSPVMYCGLMVDCGTRHESTPDLYGMAHFVEHILFKGTRTRDSWHINNRMESVGGELNAFTTKEETTFYAIGLNKDFARACELLCDLVCHPTAPQHELEKEREVVVDEIMSYRDTPSELIYDEMENRLWTLDPVASALGHNILGSADTVRRFDHDCCMRFIDSHYLPGRMVFFHQGQTPFSRVVRCVERWFDRPALAPVAAASSPAAVPVADALAPDEGPVVHLPMDTHQAHVLIGAPSFAIGHPDAAALALLNNMLGGPGMNSRLGLELRERRGLVYTVESNITSYTDTGYVGIYFGCDHADVRRCLSVVHRQLGRFSASPLTQRQLLNAQKQLCGQLGVSRGNLENNAIALAKNLLRLGHVESLDQTCRRIMAVTPADVLRVAQKVFSSGLLKTIIIE